MTKGQKESFCGRVGMGMSVILITMTGSQTCMYLCMTMSKHHIVLFRHTQFSEFHN